MCVTVNLTRIYTKLGDDWAATYYPSYSTYLLDGIKGFAPAYPDYFALWVNHKYSSLSVCDPGLQEGDDVLALVDYCDSGPPPDYACLNESVMPLALDAPVKVTRGTPFTVTVRHYDKNGGLVPVAGATVSGGAAPATTDAAGHASVTVSAAGALTLRAAKTNFAGVDAGTCATTGVDGLCGTTIPPDRAAPRAVIVGLVQHRRYRRTTAPQLLQGTVAPDPSGIRSVEIRVTRNDRRRCSYFSATTETWRKSRRCVATAGRWFAVGDRQDWSYQLPARLSRGRYVVDVRATDTKGNRDDTVRAGSSRFVFWVG